ncbi:MAG: FecR family protein [Mariniphaga sp.]
MSNIDKNRIDNYYQSGYSPDEEKYIGTLFSDISNQTELTDVIKKQWDNTLSDELDSDSHQLDHIIHKLNFQINSGTTTNQGSPVIKILKWYARIAAVLLLPLMVYTGITNFQQSRQKQEEGLAEITAPLGARIRFTLPDGSFGWLNSGSTMKYSLNFNKTREIQLSGEAFFDVTHKDNSKFVVKTNHLNVEVKGTRFNVAAFQGESETSVTLEKGSVLLTGDKITVPIEMKPNERVEYNKDNQSIKKEMVSAPIFSAWKEGKLMLRNASVEELAKQLSRWYNVDVIIENSKNIDIRYRATFEDENLKEVLRLLKITSRLDYKIEERTKKPDSTFTKQQVTLRIL